jgi:hypothetical protein
MTEDNPSEWCAIGGVERHHLSEDDERQTVSGEGECRQRFYETTSLDPPKCQRSWSILKDLGGVYGRIGAGFGFNSGDRQEFR